eukprot:5128815-Pyramimonas_sp.AAC.1
MCSAPRIQSATQGDSSMIPLAAKVQTCACSSGIGGSSGLAVGARPPMPRSSTDHASERKPRLRSDVASGGAQKRHLRQ